MPDSDITFRSALLRIAADLPAGDATRRRLLGALTRKARWSYVFFVATTPKGVDFQVGVYLGTSSYADTAVMAADAASSEIRKAFKSLGYDLYSVVNPKLAGIAEYNGRVIAGIWGELGHRDHVEAAQAIQRHLEGLGWQQSHSRLGDWA